jgi:hypothetical protein
VRRIRHNVHARSRASRHVPGVCCAVTPNRWHTSTSRSRLPGIPAAAKLIHQREALLPKTVEVKRTLSLCPQEVTGGPLELDDSSFLWDPLGELKSAHPNTIVSHNRGSENDGIADRERCAAPTPPHPFTMASSIPITEQLTNATEDDDDGAYEGYHHSTNENGCLFLSVAERVSSLHDNLDHAGAERELRGCPPQGSRPLPTHHIWPTLCQRSVHP